jgi:hypothetical protein
MSNGRDFAVEGNDTSAYVGVSPEYRTYASETDAPLFSGDKDVAEVEKAAVAQEKQARGEKEEEKPAPAKKAPAKAAPRPAEEAK